MTDIVITLDQDNFAKTLSDNALVLVDFWAAWCGPCKMMSPVVDAVAQILNGKLVVGKLNVDEFSEIAAEYNVQNIPTLILFSNGEEKRRIVGYHSKEELTDMIKKYR